MRTRRYHAAFYLVVTLALSPCVSLHAQQQTFLAPVEMKGQWLRGSIAVTQHENEGMIGINGKATEAGYKLETVMPASPAASAGLLPGDVILSIDGTSVEGLDAAEALKSIVHKKEGETVNLAFVRNGETETASVTVVTRKKVLQNDPRLQEESKLPPAVSQPIFGKSVVLTASLFEVEQSPSDVFLQVYFSSGKDADAFIADDTKFFILDGTGQQLRHVSFDEIRYSIQLSVARNWKGGNYPPPPPPSLQRQYTISETFDDTYTVTQKADYSQLGYSLGLAIREYRDAKSDKKLLERANKAIASWEGSYFKSQSPVVPGENRQGGIMYWTGSNRRPQPPFRVVFFLTDPRTQKEEHITFAFGPGAERIKEDLDNKSSATSGQPRTLASLTNEDVVGMVNSGIGAQIVVAKIKTALCSFDTTPSALKKLKDAGVPDAVVLAMVEAPKN